MRFNSQQKGSQMPDVNLVPMMDVILTILTFFIIVSMTLTGQQQSVDITLPSTDTGASTLPVPDPFVVGLNQQGQVLLNNQLVSDAQLSQQMQTYLVQNSKGAVILKADRKLPYEQVIQVLGKMRDIGGDRVSLAIEQ